MRFICTVEVFNRGCALTAQPQSRRRASTLTVGGYGSSQFGGTLWILHQTATNRTGVRYKVNSNISGLFTKFIHEGKVTVRFREPAVDLKIIGEPKQVGEFVKTIRNFCAGKTPDSTKKINTTNLETAAKKIEPPPQKKLAVLNPKDLRSHKGSYPSTLEHLVINHVEFGNVDPKIFRLQHLKVLNLANNKIQRMPKSIDLLSGLCELNLAGNKMGLSVREEHWDWLRCESIRASLKVLDLSNNELLTIPNCLANLRALTTLALNDNKLIKLPNNIGLTRNLRTLFLKHNALTWLPSTLITADLEYADISDNQFLEPEMFARDESDGLCLKDMAARTVLAHRLKYDDASLPRELIRYLESACFCSCGKATFPSEPSTYTTVKPGCLAPVVVYDSSQMVTLGFRRCLIKCGRRG